MDLSPNFLLFTVICSSQYKWQSITFFNGYLNLVHFTVTDPLDYRRLTLKARGIYSQISPDTQKYLGYKYGEA